MGRHFDLSRLLFWPGMISIPYWRTDAK